MGIIPVYTILAKVWLKRLLSIFTISVQRYISKEQKAGRNTVLNTHEDMIMADSHYPSHFLTMMHVLYAMNDCHWWLCYCPMPQFHEPRQYTSVKKLAHPIQVQLVLMELKRFRTRTCFYQNRKPSADMRVSKTGSTSKEAFQLF